MYESLFKLKIKVAAGIESAKQELELREKSRVELPLRGIKGEAICVSLTHELVSKIESVQTMYQKVSKKNKVRDIILLDAYHSATIEGARTTVDNVRRVFTEPKSRDDKMVVNTVKAFDYAYRTPISEDNIRELWNIIVSDVCENESKAGSLYRDGNGRTARVITSSYLYHQGYEKMMYLPLSRTINENISGYYGNIKDSEWEYKENGRHYLDITPFVSYLLEMFEKCIITSLLEEQELDEDQKLLLSKMKKHGAGAEITVKNAMKILKKSEEEVCEYYLWDAIKALKLHT